MAELDRVGRGFVVENDFGDRCIITAAHCLPEVPDCCCLEAAPCYHNLIGPLGEKSAVTAEVVFIDPIADIAVPSGWEKDYEALVGHPLPISGPLKECLARAVARWQVDRFSSQEI